MDLKIPITMLTKNAEFCGKDNHVIQSTEQFLAISDWLVNIKMFQEDYQERLAIGFTLTGHDELESNASPNMERIATMKRMADSGFKVWASIEPVITFPAALDMVYQAVNAGCQHFKFGLLTNNTRLVRKDFAFDEHHFDAYKVNDCLHFVEDVMRVTSGKTTVYWKQSVRDLLETAYTPAAVDELLNYPHSVGKDWNMFNQKQ